MADPLYELLAPHFDAPDSSSPTSTTPTTRSVPSADDPVTTVYLARLSTLSLSALTTTESHTLAQASHSSLISLQALSTRSHKSVITASDHLTTLRTTLPQIAEEATSVQDAIPKLDEDALRFSQAYSKTADTPVLDRRRKAMLLARNVDRLSDIMELPSLLSSAISSSTSSSAVSSTAVSASSSTANYGSALDLDGHIKRLHTLYPHSPLIQSVSKQAEQAMRGMASNLISNLRAPGIKLAAAMRAVEWLRRIAPELEDAGGSDRDASRGGGLEALFLVCRLSNLVSMLDALEPLRDLADHETQRQGQNRGRRKGGSESGWSGGQQTERYLKRYIEIFREQTFVIISMFKSIFPSSVIAMQDGRAGSSEVAAGKEDPLQPLPSALSTFPLHLIDLLAKTLQAYLPNVRDKASRESLLTQVLYCAGSLGRLGGDFSMILAMLEEGEEDEERKKKDDDDDEEKGDDSPDSDVQESQPEWVEVMQKHRVLAGRLELLASGAGGGGSHGSVEAG